MRECLNISTNITLSAVTAVTACSLFKPQFILKPVVKIARYI